MRIRLGLFVGIALALLAGAAATGPAAAQAQQSLNLNGRTFALSGEELARLTDLRLVVHGDNRAAQDQALAAARAVVHSPDGRYVLALYEDEIGRQRHDDAMRAPALDVLIADQQTRADRLPAYLGVRGDIAFRAHDYATAAATWGRLAELRPHDPQALVNLAQVREAQGDHAGAVALIHRALAEPGHGDEIWYRQWLSIAYNARLLDEGVAAARALVGAYPSAENWRLALVLYRQLAAPQGSAEIDLYRLMRVAGVIAHADEYQRFTQLLLHSGAPDEARAVLNEGVSRGIVNEIHAPIPDIRREIDSALQRPAAAAAAPDAAPAGYRPAVALALAGRRPEAEAAFRTVAGGAAGGPRWYPDLAAFWLLWLARTG